jgi:hypothetical protein
MGDSKQFSLLRRLLKALGLSDERVDELVALIQSWLLGEKEDKESKLPYKLRDDFLSPAELNFYRVLQTITADWAIVFTKVGLGDLFYPQTGDYGQNISYRNKIDRKHVDFLLCDPGSVRPKLGIELDDSSHQRADRKERDLFVDAVFKVAGLPLARIPVRQSYPTEQLKMMLQEKAGIGVGLTLESKVAADPIPEIAPPTVMCPLCGSEMILRTAKSGPNKGNQFWGCSTYPKCRGIISTEG